MVKVVFIPISLAAPASSETALIALPIFVLLTSSCNSTISTTEVKIVTTVTILTLRSPIATGSAFIIGGKALPEDEKKSCAKFCNRRLMPIAVIRREILGTS
ncbi:hypothetical protein SDC9_167191 [bioreactor metagenome]|uniref:Uncharacterized protein n=1 Tax=bioreactor metagenome TaxID=1076179 RepID=A0A645G1Y9_9ZZZZ